MDDKRSGFLVARGDCEAMAEKILLLLENSALRTQFGEAGRQIAEQKFDLRKNVGEVLQLYEIA